MILDVVLLQERKTPNRNDGKNNRNSGYHTCRMTSHSGELKTYQTRGPKHGTFHNVESKVGLEIAKICEHLKQGPV